MKITIHDDHVVQIAIVAVFCCGQWVKVIWDCVFLLILVDLLIITV